ncbi:hypothetical protein EDD86DRAFT_243870 [Gorgonomyces haynaldii]|nr:hypothetical protein EDD86DRAFT_243870 [Gorgonomyces haynaldii]
MSYVQSLCDFNLSYQGCLAYLGGMVYKVYLGKLSTKLRVMDQVAVMCVIDTVGKGNLVDPPTFFGIRVDVAKVLRIVRVVTLLHYVTVFSVWAFYAVSSSGSIQLYIVMRRVCYISTAFVAVLVSAPVHYNYGSFLIKEMEASRNSDGQTDEITRGSRSAANVSGVSLKLEDRTSMQVDRRQLKSTTKKVGSNALWSVKFAFWGVFNSNILLGIIFIGLMLFNDFGLDYPETLLVVKIVTELLLLGITSLTFVFMMGSSN